MGKSGFLYLAAAFLYGLWGASHSITSRDFVCHKVPITAEIG